MISILGATGRNDAHFLLFKPDAAFSDHVEGPYYFTQPKLTFPIYGDKSLAHY